MRISPRIAWLLVVALSSPAFAEKDATPTPTPRKHSTKHRFPAATASASPKKEPFQTETADESESDAEPTPKKKRTKAKASATPTPEPEETPLPDPSPSATPDSTPTPSASPAKRSDYAENATLETSGLKEFAAQPAPIQRLITAALELTRQDLSYTYGSSDPANGGMDCSGFIYHVLQQEGMPEVPRDASGQYVWVRKAGTFRAVVGLKDSSFELNEMRPGDLLFWSGTYNAQKDPPVTHTMIYLGREAKTGQRVMVGSSDGRSYEGKRRWGVSVFDFKMPGPKSVQKGVDFIGYAHLPSLEKIPLPGSTATPAEASSPTPSPEPTASAEPESDSSPTATPRAKAKAKTKSKRHSRPAQ